MPDTNFWHFVSDFITDVKPEVDDESPSRHADWDLMRNSLMYLPGFMHHKDLNHELEKYKFLLPDPYIGRGHHRAYVKTYQELLDQVQEGIDMYDWDDKEDLAAWFG